MRTASKQGLRILVVLLVSCSQLLGGSSGGGLIPAQLTPADTVETGLASFYADQDHGRTTASGETFDRNELTAAHRTLPFGTKVKVTYLANHRSVIVRINDRGPFVAGRIIDVSPAAAEELQMKRAGLANVRVEIIKPAS